MRLYQRVKPQRKKYSERVKNKRLRTRKATISFKTMLNTFSLTYDRPTLIWEKNTAGIPQRRPGDVIAGDAGLMNDLFRTFAFGSDSAVTKPGSMRTQPTCSSNPQRTECNTRAVNRSSVFPPQQLYSQNVGAQEGPACDGNIARSSSKRTDSMYSEDVPRVYVTDGCKPITPEVGPNEPTRDTTYGKMLWMNPVFTFPDVVDTQARAEGLIWDSQRRASDNFDEWHYETFTKNSPDYVRYSNY